MLRGKGCIFRSTQSNIITGASIVIDTCCVRMSNACCGRMSNTCRVRMSITCCVRMSITGCVRMSRD